MRKASRLLLIVSVLLLFSPLALRANTVTEHFTIDIGGNATNLFGSDPIAKFDPTLGTLNSFSVTVTGKTTWDATVSNDKLDVALIDTNATQSFIANGGTTGNNDITINLSGNNSSNVLQYWTGTGSNSFNLNTVASGTVSDTLNYATLNGTLTYKYTPASPVPEPSSVVLLGTGLLGLVVIGGFKKRAA